ncbi:hypothetical protein [Oceanicoccus sagamiensis]|uniref:Uncharacterized protein n=1 Tax=Oceanicoccus sagamiensis TaxID=716816 RepID=A0A1X9N8W7_9GAMM|nr:hypothetical protein [Oceanicoccus sagamiensis]ARN73621.1 hypothetical protein BST96_05495 [Oceanicoccus sagamiensis]
MNNKHLPATSRESIFHDRRTLTSNHSDTGNTEPCRRKTFAQSNTQDWWLKVNYVSQHLHAVAD